MNLIDQHGALPGNTGLHRQRRGALSVPAMPAYVPISSGHRKAGRDWPGPLRVPLLRRRHRGQRDASQHYWRPNLRGTVTAIV